MVEVGLFMRHCCDHDYSRLTDAGLTALLAMATNVILWVLSVESFIYSLPDPFCGVPSVCFCLSFCPSFIQRHFIFSRVCNSFRLAQDGTLARYLLPCSVFTFTIYSARFVPNPKNGSVCVCVGGGGGI